MRAGPRFELGTSHSSNVPECNIFCKLFHRCDTPSLLHSSNTTCHGSQRQIIDIAEKIRKRSNAIIVGNGRGRFMIKIKLSENIFYFSKYCSNFPYKQLYILNTKLKSLVGKTNSRSSNCTFLNNFNILNKA